MIYDQYREKEISKPRLHFLCLCRLSSCTPYQAYSRRQSMAETDAGRIVWGSSKAGDDFECLPMRFDFDLQAMCSSLRVIAAKRERRKIGPWRHEQSDLRNKKRM